MPQATECPVLPAGPIDFDALCAAAKKGDAELAAFIARPVEVAAAPEPEPVIAAPAGGKTAPLNAE
jgi:hypothetical protein